MWLIKNNFKNKPKVKFIKDRLSIVELPNTVIIGVYMRFNDQKFETVVEQSHDLNEMVEIVKNAGDKRVMIVGDYNMDLHRNNKFDNLLVKFIEENDLTALDLLYTQPIKYTFQSGNGESWIDHIVGNVSMAEDIINVNVLSKSSNTSDHLALEVEFYSNENRLSQINNKKESIESKVGQKLDWGKKSTSNEYEKHLNSLLEPLDPSTLLSAKETNVVAATNEFINELQSRLRKAVEMTKISCERNKSKHVKKKSWWDSELGYIKEQVCHAYVNYRNSDFLSQDLKNNYKSLRTYFRYKQRDKKRKNLKGYQRKLEILRRQNKSKFWKDMKRNRKKPVEVNIKTDELKNSFEELFNKKLVKNSQNEKLIEEMRCVRCSRA